jgi:pimeloyl-ACP methyl ester carboxylesterase
MSLPIRFAILCSGGGFTPLSEERETLLAYDTTAESMRAVLHAMLGDPKWGDDEAYVAKRQEIARLPGAFECACALFGITAAKKPAGQGSGIPDKAVYENVEVPVLIVAGANDPLREPGYSTSVAERIPDNEHHLYENCGHCPNIEFAERFNAEAIDFLKRVNAR